MLIVSVDTGIDAYRLLIQVAMLIVSAATGTDVWPIFIALVADLHKAMDVEDHSGGMCDVLSRRCPSRYMLRVQCKPGHLHGSVRAQGSS
jgi:hypothetical protein